MRLLFLSTPVGPLGSGLGGGVELTVRLIAQAMLARGHQVRVVAPQGSYDPAIPPDQMEQVPGEYQPTAQTQVRTAAIALPANSVLANQWLYARQVQADFDVIVNFAYDWLPFYLTPFFQTPIAHFISMGSLGEALDRVGTAIAMAYPGTLGVYTQTQAATFPFAAACRCLGSGLDLSQYEFCATPDRALGWLGRISPEKGLADAVAVAQATGLPLRVMGKLENPEYWQQVQADYPAAPIEYLGFLTTAELQAQLRRCQALLMTPRWVEAFGMVAIEALACGVPVIAYARGGPTEIVRPGQTGWLVEPDSVSGLIAAVGQIAQLDRHACRQQAEQEYSLTALGDRFEAWFQAVSAGSGGRG